MTTTAEDKDDLNPGVQIILNRMKTNPEEFFDDGGRWRWMFRDNMREVMTEIEKAAIYEAMKQVRRQEITAKAAATVLQADNQEQTGYQTLTGALTTGYGAMSSTTHDEYMAKVKMAQVQQDSLQKIREANSSLKEMLTEPLNKKLRPQK